MLGHNMLEESQRESGFSSQAYGVRFSRIPPPPVARYASLTGG